MSHPTHLPLSDVLSIVIDSFTGATERHIEASPYFSSLLAVPLTLGRFKVGDGLEIYVVLAKGQGLHGLDAMRGAQDIGSTADGERMFVIRRDLKKD